MSGSPEQDQDEQEDERAEGKGSGRDDDDDPADGFEDGADSQQVDDAQATLGQIEADVQSDATESVGEAGTNAVESGRYGLASNSAVLQNPFEHAQDIETPDEVGIKDGATTADDMEVITMEDGSRVYVTPSSAYPTVNVRSYDKAVDNNVRSAKVVESLGGDSCSAEALDEVEYGADGEYIAKEGVEGDVVYDVDSDDVGDNTTQSAVDTFSAAYYTGNTDLHPGNLVVDDDGAVVIIDNDNAGLGSNRSVTDIEYYTEGTDAPETVGGEEYEQQTREKIYDLGHQITSGERELGVDKETAHHEYAQNAAQKAVRASYVDSAYDAPSETVPSELQAPPDGYETITDFDTGDEVSFVTERGDIVSGEVNSATDRTLTIEASAGVQSMTVFSGDERNLSRVTNVE